MMFDVRTLDDDAISRIAEDHDVVRRILAAANLVTMDGVGEWVGISYYRVKMLRLKRLELEAEGVAGDIPRSDALPPALPLPGDPVWHLNEIDTWGRQTGRIDWKGNPQRARPTGRPRRQRQRTKAAA